MKCYFFKPNAENIFRKYCQRGHVNKSTVESSCRLLRKIIRHRKNRNVYYSYNNIHGLSKDHIALHIDKSLIPGCEILVVPSEMVRYTNCKDKQKYVSAQVQVPADYRQWNLMTGFDSVSVFLLHLYTKRTVFIYTGIYRFMSESNPCSYQGTLSGCRAFAKQHLKKDISLLLFKSDWKLTKIN